LPCFAQPCKRPFQPLVALMVNQQLQDIMVSAQFFRTVATTF